MPLNQYYQFGIAEEQDLVEDLIIEAISIYGYEFLYIPRKYVAKDDILGEDRLSKFEHAYPIEAYFENIDSFSGQGSFLTKFGNYIEQSATISVARKRWQTLVGDTGNSILPTRPSEGDLIYFPVTKGLFEIMFVQHQDPFYQLGKPYLYKLQIELYRYSSQNLETGEDVVDDFEDLKSHDITVNPDPDTVDSFGDNTKFIDKATDIVWSENNPFGE